MNDNIHVAVRMRPLNPREIESNAQVHWNAQKSAIYQANQPAVAFHFDRVFQGHENNEAVYSEFCSPIVKSVIDGFNGTIFAYGQTSSGKTFTMLGDGIEKLKKKEQKQRGVIEYTIDDIFSFIQEMPEREFLLRVSYMEIYNEMVRDLLSDKSDKNENLKLHEDLDGLITISGLSEHIVQEKDQVINLMEKAQRKRRVGETAMNDKSSRSHSIFRMIIESGIRGESEAAVNVSQFNLVDLAGSERARQTGATGARFKESVNINKSLLMLSQVISQLSEKVVQDTFINYRGSKLTRILQNSLGGNARTAIICTVTPACHSETLSTLKFAERAKAIKNKPKVNEVLTEQALLKQYANKIKKLTEELEATKEEKAQENKSLKEQIQNLKKNFVFQITPSIKNRSNRRETWGGPVDAARLRLDIQTLRKPLHSISMSSEENIVIPPPRKSGTPKRKLMPSIEERSSMPCAPRNRFGSYELPTLPEEVDGDEENLGENESLYTQSSKRFSRQSYDISQLENIFQTDLEVTNMSTLPSETLQVQKMKERIQFLEKELAELTAVTTLERQILRSKRPSVGSNELSLNLGDPNELNLSQQKSPKQSLAIATDSGSYSYVEASNSSCIPQTVGESVIKRNASTLTGKPLPAEDSGLEHTLGQISQRKSESQRLSTLQELNRCNEELYDYLGNTMRMLGMRKNIDLLPEQTNLNPHYQVMLDMFNLILQNQCLTFKGTFKTDLSERISKISANLADVFQHFKDNSSSEDATEELIDNFTNATDEILKEIEMFSLDSDDGKHGIMNNSPYSESFLQRQSFDNSVLDMSNIKSPRIFPPLGNIAEDSREDSKNELSYTATTAETNTELAEINTTSTENNVMSIENALKEQISTLEKDIEEYKKSIANLQYESELKDDQVSNLKNKVDAQEKTIEDLKYSRIPALENEVETYRKSVLDLECEKEQSDREMSGFKDKIEVQVMTIEDLKDQMYTLEKEIETYKMSIADINHENDLKVKEVSIFKDKVEAMEKIIDDLKDELSAKASQTGHLEFTDAFAQTHEELLGKQLGVDSSTQTIEEIAMELDTVAVVYSDSYVQTIDISCINSYVQTSDISCVDSYAQTIDINCVDSCSQTDNIIILSSDLVFTNSSCQTSSEFLPNISALMPIENESHLFNNQPNRMAVLSDQFAQTSDLSFSLQNLDVSLTNEEGLKVQENDISSKDLQDKNRVNDGHSEIAMKSEDAQSLVEVDLQGTLNELLELRIFALEFMKREMKKYLGDVEFLENNASSPILDQIKIEVTALKELLVRLEFYIKNQNEHSEHFNQVLEKNILENGMLKEQLDRVESTLKEKDAEQLNMSKLLAEMDHSISELMQNVKTNATMARTSNVDCKEISAKFKSVTQVKLLQKKLSTFGSLITKNSSLVTDLSARLKDMEDKLNTKHLEVKEEVSRLTKNIQTAEDSRLTEMSKKLGAAEVCVEDLKKEINNLTYKLEAMINDKENLEAKLQESNSGIHKLKAEFHADKLKWSAKTMECVKQVEEKCDQMMIEQENKFFDDIDKLKQEHKMIMSKRTEVHNKAEEQWEKQFEELSKEHQINMTEVREKLTKEISERFKERSKLEEEISSLKVKISSLTQLNTLMKDKFKRYSMQMQHKLKEKPNTNIEDRGTQTDLLPSKKSEMAPDKTATENPRAEDCPHCKVLKRKIFDLQTSKQSDNPDTDIELSKRLKKELSDLKGDLMSAKSNNINLTKENVSLKRDLTAKLVLLRSCNCRINPKPLASVTNEANSLDDLEASAEKKRKLDNDRQLPGAKPSGIRRENEKIDSADILKNEVVQRAIKEEAKAMQMAALSNGSGPDGQMKCAYLAQKLKKKDKELEKKNEEMEQLRRELATNASSSKKISTENIENQPGNAAKDKKSFRPYHPYPQGAVPKVQPKKILKEANSADPALNCDYLSTHIPPKKINMGDNVENRVPVTNHSVDVLKVNPNEEKKPKSREYEKRQQLEKIVGPVPECKQQ